MPVEVMKKFEEVFGCIVLEGYGLSETSPVASFNRPDLERRRGTIGVPVRGVEMRLVDADVEQHWVSVECLGGLHLPRQWRNATGQLRMDAPYCHRDFRRPVFEGPRDDSSFGSNNVG